MGVGISLGSVIASKIEQAAARKFSLLVAAAGAAAAILRGLSSL